MTVPYPVVTYPDAVPVRTILVEKGLVTNFAFYAGDPNGDPVTLAAILNIEALVADPVKIEYASIPNDVVDLPFLNWINDQPNGKLYRFDVQIETVDVPVGSHKIGFQIQDDKGAQNTVAFNLVITKPNDPPFVTG